MPQEQSVDFALKVVSAAKTLDCGGGGGNGTLWNQFAGVQDGLERNSHGFLANNDLMKFLSDSFFFLNTSSSFKTNQMKQQIPNMNNRPKKKKIHQNKSRPGVRFLGQAVLGYF